MCFQSCAFQMCKWSDGYVGRQRPKMLSGTKMVDHATWMNLAATFETQKCDQFIQQNDITWVQSNVWKLSTQVTMVHPKLPVKCCGQSWRLPFLNFFKAHQGHRYNGWKWGKSQPDRHGREIREQNTRMEQLLQGREHGKKNLLGWRNWKNKNQARIYVCGRKSPYHCLHPSTLAMCDFSFECKLLQALHTLEKLGLGTWEGCSIQHSVNYRLPNYQLFGACILSLPALAIP